jgi:hypothetical protein
MAFLRSPKSGLYHRFLEIVAREAVPPQDHWIKKENSKAFDNHPIESSLDGMF